MMKKNGFTLAEVLITLAIIGVVATMTLPALMTNTQEQQAKTGLKKGINTLTEAAQMNQALEGWDYATTTDTSETALKRDSDTSTQSFTSLIANRATVDYKLGNTLPTKGPASTQEGGLQNYSAIYLRDGSAIYYLAANVVAKKEGSAKLVEDGLPVGYVVYYDTNGAAGPNIVSNCSSVATGTTTDGGAWDLDAATATEKCNVKTARVIKDIFAVRLRGNQAFPEGYAAIWAFSGDITTSASGS